MTAKSNFFIKVVSLIIFTCFTHSSFAHQDKVYKILPEFDSYLNYVFSESKVPGIAIAIVSNNMVVYQKYLGVRQSGTNNKIDQHTIFRIASLSKGMTATLAAQLVEEDLLHWNTSLSSILKNFKLKSNDATSKIKFYHLLNHSSGFSKTELSKAIESKNSRENIQEKLSSLDLVCRVGKCFSYQNYIFDLSSDVMETITKKKFEDLMKSKIFDPLKMQDSSVGSSAFVLFKNKALPHLYENNSYQVRSNEIISRYYKVNAAAGVNSSMHDMIIWLKACMGEYPKVISHQITSTIMTPTIDIKHKKNQNSILWEDIRVNKMQYGLGWRIFDYDHHKLIFHAGALNGYSSIIGFLPEQKVGIVVLSNASTKLPSILMAKYLDLYLNLPQIDYYSNYFKK